MAIFFDCVCGTPLEALDAQVGRKIMCPVCRSDLTVPVRANVLPNPVFVVDAGRLEEIPSVRRKSNWRKPVAKILGIAFCFFVTILVVFLILVLYSVFRFSTSSERTRIDKDLPRIVPPIVSNQPSVSPPELFETAPDERLISPPEINLPHPISRNLPDPNARRVLSIDDQLRDGHERWLILYRDADFKIGNGRDMYAKLADLPIYEQDAYRLFQLRDAMRSGLITYLFEDDFRSHFQSLVLTLNDPASSSLMKRVAISLEEMNAADPSTGAPSTRMSRRQWISAMRTEAAKFAKVVEQFDRDVALYFHRKGPEIDSR